LRRKVQTLLTATLISRRDAASAMKWFRVAPLLEEFLH
jgi:hypothetical protein